MENLFSTTPLTWDELNAALAVRFFINLLAVTILVRGIYFKNYKRTELFLTFFAFNCIIFLVSHLLNKVEMTTGAAFGLFAVFSILRYRTEGISARDMTYLFLSIAIGLITAVSKGNWIEQSVFCVALLLLTYLLESNLLIKREQSKQVVYDNLQGIHPGDQTRLLEDLKKRTGLNIHRLEINEIDLLKDYCTITIFYYE
jgi:hypothetical protein